MKIIVMLNGSPVTTHFAEDGLSEVAVKQAKREALKAALDRGALTIPESLRVTFHVDGHVAETVHSARPGSYLVG